MRFFKVFANVYTLSRSFALLALFLFFFAQDPSSSRNDICHFLEAYIHNDQNKRHNLSIPFKVLVYNTRLPVNVFILFGNTAVVCNPLILKLQLLMLPRTSVRDHTGNSLAFEHSSTINFLLPVCYNTNEYRFLSCQNGTP